MWCFFAQFPFTVNYNNDNSLAKNDWEFFQRRNDLRMKPTNWRKWRSREANRHCLFIALLLAVCLMQRILFGFTDDVLVKITSIQTRTHGLILLRVTWWKYIIARYTHMHRRPLKTTYRQRRFNIMSLIHCLWQHDANVIKIHQISRHVAYCVIFSVPQLRFQLRNWDRLLRQRHCLFKEAKAVIIQSNLFVYYYEVVRISVL